MPFIYPMANTLGRSKKVGDGSCVALVRFYADAPDHRRWQAGAKVMDNQSLAIGTAIATFEGGKYPNKVKGNHAALFLRYAGPGEGFWVMDQWKDRPGQQSRPVSARQIRPDSRKNADGTWWNTSDNANAFFMSSSQNNEIHFSAGVDDFDFAR